MQAVYAYNRFRTLIQNQEKLDPEPDVEQQSAARRGQLSQPGILSDKVQPRHVQGCSNNSTPEWTPPPRPDHHHTSSPFPNFNSLILNNYDGARRSYGAVAKHDQHDEGGEPAVRVLVQLSKFL